jgi:hypothetical protein
VRHQKFRYIKAIGGAQSFHSEAVLRAGSPSLQMHKLVIQGFEVAFHARQALSAHLEVRGMDEANCGLVACAVSPARDRRNRRRFSRANDLFYQPPAHTLAAERRDNVDLNVFELAGQTQP